MGFAEIVREKRMIPTYTLQSSEKAPVFFDLRNHQGTNGSIYPLSFQDGIADVKTEQVYDAVRLENEYIRVVVLPALGGRIYEAYDKQAGYHFVYKNNVIKPAMIGLAGAWISGGIEFNWPQHHRPTTFLPMDAAVEEGEGGEKTVWMGEIEPLYGMKGMVGVSIHPEKAYINVKARVYNATPYVQSFHWWANLAVHVNDNYQLKFPPDIDYITYHYKDEIAPFPNVKGTFARVDFGPEGKDITWYKNIQGPSSFFILNSNYNFMGGYDHGRNRGTVHIADRHISPGKKFFTWGTQEFGEVWQKNLTDADGPYIEIMTGCYMDNQPDFTFIQPYETKTFEQTWYALCDVPELKNANKDGAVSLFVQAGEAVLGLCVTAVQTGARAVLRCGGHVLLDTGVDLQPGSGFTARAPLGKAMDINDLQVALYDARGEEIVGWAYTPPFFSEKETPRAHAPSRLPNEIPTVEELYLEGQQLEQYRHPTRDPQPYYEEGLRRDPLNASIHTTLGLRALRQGNYGLAETHFTTAHTRLTARNYNPYDGQSMYYLGIALKKQGKYTQAADVLRKAAWCGAWRAAAMQEAAEIYAAQGDWNTALSCVEDALANNVRGLAARMLKSAVLRKLGRFEKAREISFQTMELDRLDYGARFELYLCQRAENTGAAEETLGALRMLTGGKIRPWLLLAGQYCDLALWQEMDTVLENCPEHPLKHYYAAYAADRQGKEALCNERLAAAAAVCMEDCFPSLDREIDILKFAAAHYPQDARAPYYLGLLYYGRDKAGAQHAIPYFETASNRDRTFHPARRMLAIAYHDRRGDCVAALREMEAAFCLHKSPRYLYELLQLRKVTGACAADRLGLLEKHVSLVGEMDELYTEYIALLIAEGAYEKAAKALRGHVFHPYEGGEGMLIRQHILAYLLLGREEMEKRNAPLALEQFTTALSYPENYHEGRKYRAREGHIYVHLAWAHAVMGDRHACTHWLEKAAAEAPGIDEAAFYRCIALRSLGRDSQAQEGFTYMRQEAETLLAGEGFAYFEVFPTGLPFEQNMQCLNAVKAATARLYAAIGMGDARGAAEAVKTLEAHNARTPFLKMAEEDSKKRIEGERENHGEKR